MKRDSTDLHRLQVATKHLKYRYDITETGARKLGRLTNAEVIHSYHIILRWAVSEKKGIKGMRLCAKDFSTEPPARAAKIMIFRIIMVSDWYTNLKQTKQVHKPIATRNQIPWKQQHNCITWAQSGKMMVRLPSMKLT